MRTSLPIVFLAVLVGCEADEPVEPQPEPAPSPEMAMCQVVVTQALASDEVSPLGFSADEVLAVAGGDHAATFTWADASTSALTLSVAVRGGARYLDREYVDDSGDGGTEIMPMAESDTGGGSSPGDSGSGDTGGGDTDGGSFEDPCSDIVAVDVTWTLATEDGRFAESFDGVLEAPAVDRATLYAELDLAALHGSFALDAATLARYDEVRAWVNAVIDANGAHGSVEGQGSKVDGDVAFAEMIAIGEF